VFLSPPAASGPDKRTMYMRCSWVVFVTVAAADGTPPPPRWTVIRQETESMQAWWCDEQKGHEKTMICTKRKMKDATPEERKAWRAAVSSDRQQMRTDPADMEEMHTKWCETHAETELCQRWAGRAQKLGKGALPDMKRELPPQQNQRHLAESDQMIAAWCTPEHQDEAPCLKKRLADMHAQGQGQDGKESIVAMMKGLSHQDHAAQRERMFEFWCNDPQNDRDESGLCLSWKLRRERERSHTIAKDLAGDSGRPDPHNISDRVGLNHDDREQFHKEMEKMHEWYCTGTRADVEESETCIMWRMRLKTLSDEERRKYKDMLKDLHSKKRERMKEAKDQLRNAMKEKDPEGITKARAELAEVQEHGRGAFDEMRRAWCEEGEGKTMDDAEQGSSLVCARWRDEKIKSEL